jgi:hypothetical protein
MPDWASLFYLSWLKSEDWDMVSIERARCFVHAHGNLWERALWDYLFDRAAQERVQRCLAVYKNADGGWGHGLEHDIKTPDSNPLMLEFLLSIQRDTDLPMGDLLDGTPEWVESVQDTDGSLSNPTSLKEYPRAQWWEEGQMAPDSITGNLIRLGICPTTVQEKTRSWVQENLTLEDIRDNKWLFMAYHAFDYFFNENNFPELKKYQEVTLDNIYQTALAHEEKGETQKLFPFFQFATGPESIVAKKAPEGLIDRILDHLEGAQREDGGWDDEHNLDYWQPYFSTVILLALKRFGRI